MILRNYRKFNILTPSLGAYICTEVIFLEEKILYDENWQNVTSPEYPVLNEMEETSAQKPENPEPKPINIPKQYLLTFQLVVCILAGIGAFALKSIGGDTCETIRDWYYSELNNTAIFDNNSGFDSNLLPGRTTPDEAENS